VSCEIKLHVVSEMWNEVICKIWNQVNRKMWKKSVLLPLWSIPSLFDDCLSKKTSQQYRKKQLPFWKRHVCNALTEFLPTLGSSRSRAHRFKCEGDVALHDPAIVCCRTLWKPDQSFTSLHADFSGASFTRISRRKYLLCNIIWWLFLSSFCSIWLLPNNRHRIHLIKKRRLFVASQEKIAFIAGVLESPSPPFSNSKAFRALARICFRGCC